MRLLLRLVDFIVDTSLFTAFCALGLCLATERLLPGGMLPLFNGMHRVVFGGTLVVYTLPRLLYGDQAVVRKILQLLFFAAGVVLTIEGATLLPWHTNALCMMLGALAFAYFLPTIPFGDRRRLREFGIVKILVLTFVWLGATALVPMSYLNISPVHYPAEIAIRFVFVFALCVLFDIRDVQIDQLSNIATIPHKTGIAVAYKLVYWSLGLFLLLSIWQFVLHPSYPRLVASVVTIGVTALVAVYVRRHPGHRLFVVMTDGMMLLYALLVIYL